MANALAGATGSARARTQPDYQRPYKPCRSTGRPAWQAIMPTLQQFKPGRRIPKQLQHGYRRINAEVAALTSGWVSGGGCSIATSTELNDIEQQRDCHHEHGAQSLADR